MAEKVDHRPDVRRETIRPDRQGAAQGGRLLTPKMPGEKSPFDKVMEDKNASESGVEMNSGGSNTNTETREAIRSVASQQERFGRPKEDLSKKTSSRDRDDDRDDSGKPGASKEVAGPRAKEADRRVIGRSSTGEREHGEGGQGGQGFGSGSGRQGRGAPLLPAEMQAVPGEGLVIQNVRGRFEMELQAAQSVGTTTHAAPPPKPPRDPNVIPKTVMDQLVQYCRIVTKTDGDKELDMQLHEEAFKGLKLKVSVSKGKVDATFIAQSEDVLKLFNSQKGELRKALAEKGIDVGSINVVMV
jgi:hypothetical protein